MKKTAFVLALAVVIGLIFYATEGAAHGPGMMGGGGYGGWYCPYCGQPMGPGGGYGMGPGMMGPGYGMGPGMMGWGYGVVWNDPHGRFLDRGDRRHCFSYPMVGGIDRTRGSSR